MSNHIEITEKMLTAAVNSGKTLGILGQKFRLEDVKRMIASAVGAMPPITHKAKYDLWVNTTIDIKKARFLGTTERRGYFRIETEEGKELIVHANDIQPSRVGK